MPRSYQSQTSDHFDLLPFIAILMCMLGCLLMVTMSIAALSIGPGVGEGWIPRRSPEMKNMTPILIEWDGEKAIIHDEDGIKVAKWSEPSGYLLSNGTWYPLKGRTLSADISAFLESMSKRRATHYALFAVRPSGFGNFQLFADEFRGRKIDVGYEPIRQDKPVRLIEEKVIQ